MPNPNRSRPHGQATSGTWHKELNDRLYVGRAIGEQVRKDWQLDLADKDPNVTVDVKIEGSSLVGMSTSFWLALLAPSIVAAGSSDSFRKKFHVQDTKFS